MRMIKVHHHLVFLSVSLLYLFSEQRAAAEEVTATFTPATFAVPISSSKEIVVTVSPSSAAPNVSFSADSSVLQIEELTTTPGSGQRVLRVTGVSEGRANLVATHSGLAPTGGLESAEGSVEANLTVNNQTACSFSLLWVDYDGNEVYYQTVAPFGSITQPSWVTHPWRLRDLENNALVMEIPPLTGDTIVNVAACPEIVTVGTATITVGATTIPSARATTATPVVAVGEAADLDGNGSTDTDEIGGLPDIAKYIWTIVNLTTAQPPVIVESITPRTNVILNQPGEYEATLVVIDHDGESSVPGSTEAHVSIQVSADSMDAFIAPSFDEHEPFEHIGSGNFRERNGGRVGPADELGDPVRIAWTLDLTSNPPRPTPPPGGVFISVIVRAPGGGETVVLAETRVLAGNAIPAATDPATQVKFLTNNGALSHGRNILEWTGRLARSAVPMNGSQVFVTIVPFIVTGNRDVRNEPAKSQINIRVRNNLSVQVPNAAREVNGDITISTSQDVELFASVPSAEGGGLANPDSSSSNEFLIVRDANGDGIGDPDFQPVPISGNVQDRGAEFKIQMVGKWNQRGLNGAPAPAGRYLIFARCNMATRPLQIAVTSTPAVLHIKPGIAYISAVGRNIVEDGDTPTVRYEVHNFNRRGNREEPFPAGTTFSWKFEFPGEHHQVRDGFDPKVVFAAPGDKETRISNPIYWYADKEFAADPCAPSRTVSYDIICEITLPNAVKQKLRHTLIVAVPPHAGKTTKPITSNRNAILANLDKFVEPIRDEDESLIGYKFVSFDGSGIREHDPRVRIFLRTTSQFYDKIKAHEEVHVNQFKGAAEPNLKAWWSTARASEYINAELKGKTYNRQGTIQNLRNMVADDIINSFDEYVGLESRDFESRIQENRVLNAIIERPAYDVSDLIPPKVLGQGDCVLGDGGRGDGALVQPKPIAELRQGAE